MSKIVIAFFLCLGLLLFAKPGYHLVKRTSLHLQAQEKWQGWKEGRQESQIGDPIGWLKIEEARTDTLILKGTPPETLHEFPGLSDWGALPDQKGLKIILGHRDLHFKHLGSLKTGSAIQLESIKGTQSFTVVETEIISPEKAEAKLRELRKEDGMAVVTCYPFQYIGPAPLRFVVWAVAEKN